MPHQDIFMAKQRKTRNLGINRSKYKEQIYQYIENGLGIKEKLCSRGTSKKINKYGVVHEGKNPLPIRNFNMDDAYVNSNGKVVIGSGDGLQPYCISCERKYRAGRLNKNRNKFSGMRPEEIYNYYKRNYKNLKKCSRCEKEKRPEEFPISRGMETGLHNVCKECSKAYSESVGERWIIYSPDGHEVLDITDTDSCQICNTNENLTKDHIWPLSKGGTDNKENLQVLCSKHNGSKSDTVTITSVHEVKKEMICERYQEILNRAQRENWTVGRFELEISKAVKNFILWKRSLSDEKLKEFFESEKTRNNRKHSSEHAVRKFRQYCNKAILDISKEITENS